MPKKLIKKFKRTGSTPYDRDYEPPDDLAEVDVKDWSKSLRDRDKLVKRGSATAIGIHVAKNQLRTINAGLRDQLVSDKMPLGFGTPTKSMDRESELLDCLHEVRELLVTLSFHLDVSNFIKQPAYVPVVRDFDLNLDSSGTTRNILSANDKIVGTIALLGLVNRYSSAVFSDHHGLLLRAEITGKLPLNIYYQSLDATQNFIGGTSVRSEGSLLTFTKGVESGGSLRGAVGFSEQFLQLMTKLPDINLIILAEVGAKDAKKLVDGVLSPSDWTIVTNNENGKSGVNDVTVFYKSKLSFNYAITVEELKIGNSAVILSDKGMDSESILVGSHILNSMAKVKSIAEFLQTYKCAAIFGDTNLDSNSSKLFDIVTSKNSVTDFFTLNSSNSANTTMFFDKLLVRKP
jgi:hypothetical protein